MKNILNNKRGTILAETLIAIAMLVAAAFIVSQIMTSGSRIIRRLENETIAQNHLISAVELVKNIRDSLEISRPSGLFDGDEENCWRVLDPARMHNIELGCEGMAGWGNGTKLRITDDDFFIKFELGDDNRENLGNGFSRLIEVKAIDNNNEIAQFRVEVSWDEGKIEESFLLFNYLK